MIVYIDLVFIINYIFDFTLLTSVDFLLKRNTQIKRIVLASFIGELSMLSLFINMNSSIFNLFKLVLSFIMCVTAFKYKSMKYSVFNVIYLYLVGIILGGFIYYLYNEFKVGGSFSLKYLLIILTSPFILYIYYRLTQKFKTDYNNRYKLEIKYATFYFKGTAFLDSGNKLISPISGKPIILVEKEYIRYQKLKLLPVPYNALNYHGIVYCFEPRYVKVNDNLINGVLIGISDIKFNIEGVQALLNSKIGGL